MKKNNMEEIDLRQIPYGVDARVEDRLSLPFGSVTCHVQGGILPERTFLRISATLTEAQRKHVKEFLAFWLA